jgi:MFS family permease
MSNPLNSQIRWFQILSALFACWFATGSWYFLWRLYLENQQIGIIDSICFAAGLLLEIPSGAMADILGRRKTLILACILMAIGYVAMGLSFSGGMILLSYFIFTIGYSFYSGADDALMYDSLVENKKESQWKKVITTKNIIMRLSAITATFIGGYLFTINMRLPALVRGLFFLLMLIALIKLPENYGRSDFKNSFQEYAKHIKDGVKQLLLPGITPLLPLFVVIGSLTGTIYVSGLLRPLLLDHAGYDGVQQSYIIGAAGLVTVIFLMFLRKYWELFSESAFIWILSLLIAGCFIWLSFASTQYWILVLVLIQIIQGIFAPLTSEFINSKIASTHRATALSALSLFQSLPYVIAAPLLGAAADTGQFFHINFGLMVLAISSILLAFWLNFRKNE